MTNRYCLKALLGGLMISLVMSCATVPPQELMERNDHAGLSAWYEQEAATLRVKVEKMSQMADMYATRSQSTRLPSSIERHCRNLVERYTKAAEEAETLAKLHAEQQKGE